MLFIAAEKGSRETLLLFYQKTIILVVYDDPLEVSRRKVARTMNAIVAVNSDWGIGYNNTQSVVIPEDRRNFRKLTDGGIIIAGKRTFDDFGRPLPNRTNIILTRDRGFTAHGISVAHSVDEVLMKIAEEDQDKVFIIGGGSIYKLFLPMCSCAYITKIESSPPSDTFFPNLDDSPDWTLDIQGEPQESGGVRYSFCRYVKGIEIRD